LFFPSGVHQVIVCLSGPARGASPQLSATQG